MICLKTMLAILLLILVMAHRHNAANSYINLADKLIREEVPLNTLVANLTQDLLAINSKATASGETFTLLDDSTLSNGNAFFYLDATTGLLTTRQLVDRELMCARRLCADPCETTRAHGHCRVNLKVLLMPTYRILDVNVLIADLNDNRPHFSHTNLTLTINEHVPIGYRIPLALALDRDVGINAVQRYELTSRRSSEADLVSATFRLAQNLAESQLHLVVLSELDREKISAYHLTLTAYDGGQPVLSAALSLDVVLLDMNDNSPVFAPESYRFFNLRYLFEHEIYVIIRKILAILT